MTGDPGGAAEWDEVAASAGVEAGLDAALLGGFLPELAAVAGGGHRLGQTPLARFRVLGERAGEAGVPLRSLVDLYLSAAWRAWRRLPGLVGVSPSGSGGAAPSVAAEVVGDVGEAVLRAVDDTVAALGEGYVAGRRAVVRREEAQRREFLDDLFAGTGDPGSLAARGEDLGLDLAGPRVVALVSASRPFRDATEVVGRIGRALADPDPRTPGEPLVATRGGLLVVVLPAGPASDPDGDVATLVAALDRVLPADRERTVAVGRPHPDASGVARSFAQARDALDLAHRLGLPDRLVRSRDLLVYTVLLRDSAAMRELMDQVLTPLRSARGGAGPLLATLHAHADSGGNAAATARSLHLSVRAVTYRLRRIHELTGWDPARPRDAYVLATAATGARALGWSLD